MNNPDSPGSFLSQTTFAVGAGPVSVAIGDLNGDGRHDLAVANHGEDTVTVLFADPAAPGSFLPQIRFQVGSQPASVAIGDLNADQRADLVVANSDDDTVSILLYDPTALGSFSLQSAISVGNGPISVAVGDLNADGWPDLAVANPLDNSVSVLLNDPATPGSLLPQTKFPVGHLPRSVAIGDLNGDGKPDLAVANEDDDTVSVMLNDAATPGSFLVQTTFDVGKRPTSVARADLNGDGRSDLAVANSQRAEVSVLESVLVPTTYLVTVDPPRIVRQIDFGARIEPDGDGVFDSIEDLAPNGGDGNGDGTPDSQQLNVTSLPNLVDGSYL
jgi:hypothetical protein